MKHTFSTLFSFGIFSGALFKLILSPSFRFRASVVAQLVKIRLKCRRPGFDPWVGKIPWRRERLPTPVFWPGELLEFCSPWGHKEKTGLSDFHFRFSQIFQT